MPAHDPPRAVHTELPGPRAKAWMQRGAYDMQAIYRSVVFDEERSGGCSLVDVDGNVFLDLFASFALGALGYNHPALVAEASSPGFVQSAINPTSTPFVTAPSWLEFVEAMEEKYAPRGMARIYCVDAGGEGVESAIKAAFIVHGERRRRAAGSPVDPNALSDAEKAEILNNVGTDAVAVSFDGAFHGRGLGPLSATHSKVIHKADLPAFPWPVVPFPANRWPLDRYADENAHAEGKALAALERTLDDHAGRVAIVMVEPMQSEGGDRHASPAFFQGVQKLARAAGAAFMLDEVQTGVGPSGTWWLHEQLGLPTPPDLVCFGKKMQMGGFFATEDYAIRQFGRMYQTRNGDRARARLALAVLRTIEGESLLQNVRENGAYFLQRLVELGDRYPKLLTEPRGRGFLLAFDLPNPQTRDDFLRRCLLRGVFASYTGTRSVRLRPHLITGRSEIDEAMNVFSAVAAEMAS